MPTLKSHDTHTHTHTHTRTRTRTHTRRTGHKEDGGDVPAKERRLTCPRAVSSQSEITSSCCTICKAHGRSAGDAAQQRLMSSANAIPRSSRIWSSGGRALCRDALCQQVCRHALVMCRHALVSPSLTRIRDRLARRHARLLLPHSVTRLVQPLSVTHTLIDSLLYTPQARA